MIRRYLERLNEDPFCPTEDGHGKLEVVDSNYSSTNYKCGKCGITSTVIRKRPYKYIIEIQTISDDLEDLLLGRLAGFVNPEFINIRVEKNES